ncbi:hypothetical protein ACFL19_00780 [Pseudomonadota bacterium]
MKDILGLMVLSWPLVLLVLIVLAILIAVPLAIRYARKSGRNKWAWGIGVFLLIFLPVFWDWAPTVLMHKYYCSTEAGFWVYKTVDEWKAENPGVMETLVANRGVSSQREGDTVTYQSNQRISMTITQQQVTPWLPVIRHEQSLYDKQTNQTLARSVNFGSHDPSWDGLKFWLNIKRCDAPFRNNDSSELRKQFSALMRQLTGGK